MFLVGLLDFNRAAFQGVIQGNTKHHAISKTHKPEALAHWINK